MTPEFRLKLIQGLLFLLDLEPCGENLVQGLQTIRKELERDPALHECIDELIAHVCDQLRGDFDSYSASEQDAYDEFNSVEQVDQMHLAKQISSDIKGWDGPAFSECNVADRYFNQDSEMLNSCKLLILDRDNVSKGPMSQQNIKPITDLVNFRNFLYDDSAPEEEKKELVEPAKKMKIQIQEEGAAAQNALDETALKQKDLLSVGAPLQRKYEERKQNPVQKRCEQKGGIPDIVVVVPGFKAHSSRVLNYVIPCL